MSQVQAPTTREALKRLILDSLERRYTSESSKAGIKTGNHYQSIKLDGELTGGFRSDRAALLDRIEFAGKRVLDLGANLGEISRAARERGADVVDGWEYDPYFVEVARLVNAYNGTTRVSFFERDITDARIYHEHYDVVLAFSVFEYLRGIVETLAAITDGAIVLETHRLEGNLESVYLNPIGRFFPHHFILGGSDWGSGKSADGERAVIVFARTHAELRAHLRGLALEVQQFSARRRAGTSPDIRPIDVRRIRWYERFFKKFEHQDAGAMLETIQSMAVDVDELALNGDLVANDLGGWVYWLAYLKGALQFTATKSVALDNAYRLLLARHWQNDPGREQDLRDESRLTALIRRRFDDFELFRSRRDAGAETEPIRIVVPEGPPAPIATRSIKRVYEFRREVPVETNTVDGYHRLFLAQLFGVAAYPCDFVAERDAVPEKAS